MWLQLYGQVGNILASTSQINGPDHELVVGRHHRNLWTWWSQHQTSEKAEGCTQSVQVKQRTAASQPQCACCYRETTSSVVLMRFAAHAGQGRHQ
jgi:hypothetical protein